MPYKSIVTITRSAATDRNMLQSAALQAEATQGHLSVVCLGVDRIQPGAYYAGANVVALQQSLEEARAGAEATEAEVREILHKHDVSWEVVALPVQIGSISQLVARYVEYADLAVLPKPYGPNRTQEDVAILEAALFGTRVPVLVLPEEAQAQVPRANRILIAWNESDEALAAVRASMPFLKAAEMVDICIVDPPTHGADRSDPGGQLAEMLSRHGVRPVISVLAKTLPTVSEVISRHAGDKAIDMVVMGAYGHSRLREAILGGATRHMLENCNLPILMVR